MEAARTLGLTSSLRRTTVRQLVEETEKASCWVCNRRDQLNCKPGTESGGLSTTADPQIGGCHGLVGEISEVWDQLNMLEPGRGSGKLRSCIHRMQGLDSRMT